MELEQALKIVKAAGYRVSKPKPKKLVRVGPTCVATFADGVVTRMSVHCDDADLDWSRGEKLARWAYESRTKSFAPAFASLHFERSGKIIGQAIR